jgi:hypothetical protein
MRLCCAVRFMVAVLHSSLAAYVRLYLYVLVQVLGVVGNMGALQLPVSALTFKRGELH